MLGEGTVCGFVYDLIRCPDHTLLCLVSSDPYVRVDLVTCNGDIVIDSVLTKTKKRVSVPIMCVMCTITLNDLAIVFCDTDAESEMG